jgi:hypothetical protein
MGFRHEKPPLWCEQKLERIETDIAKCLSLLEGNGTEGIKIKVDRLEQAHKDALWARRAAFGAVIAVVVKWLWEIATQYGSR